MTVDADAEHTLAGWYQVLSRPNEPYLRLKLAALDPEEIYYVEELDSCYSGSEFMHIGLLLTPPLPEDLNFNVMEKRDFASRLFTLTKRIPE